MNKRLVRKSKPRASAAQPRSSTQGKRQSRDDTRAPDGERRTAAKGQRSKDAARGARKKASAAQDVRPGAKETRGPSQKRRSSGEEARAAGGSGTKKRPGREQSERRGGTAEARGRGLEVRSPRAARDERAPAREASVKGASAPSLRRSRKVEDRAASRLSPGAWLFTTRIGSEQDLVDELDLLHIKQIPTIVASGLVVAADVPKRDKRPVELAFARQGFPIAHVVRGFDVAELAAELTPALSGQIGKRSEYALHVWVPDTPEGNLLSHFAEALDEALARTLEARVEGLSRVDDATLRRAPHTLLVQACVLDASSVAAGVCYGNQAISLARGGRTRVRVSGELPSRAARKLEEAFAWLGVAPGPGEVCVDLGAAPGGWTYVLCERRARVIAVDPGALRPDIAARRSVRHVRDNAFTFSPEEPVGWLFCDMAYRPLEVAALLAKWGRRRWTRILVANIKLPMKRKAEVLARVKEILHDEGDFKHVRAKQLYHDRDEVTVSAFVR